jgi:hypothetical protein
MPANPGCHSKYPDGLYAAPRKYTLVVSCVDYRLLDDLVRFLDHDNLTNRYYHSTFAGAALGLAGKVLEQPPPNIKHWKPTFDDHLAAAVLLTKGQLSDVYIVHHEDCGAFREFLKLGDAPLDPNEERALHAAYAAVLAADIRSQFGPNTPLRRKQKVPHVHTFFMTLRGNVELLPPVSAGEEVG